MTVGRPGLGSVENESEKIVKVDLILYSDLVYAVGKHQEMGNFVLRF